MKDTKKPKFVILSCSLLVGMLVLTLLLNFTLGYAESAEKNKWLVTDTYERNSHSPKPVDPIYINYPNVDILVNLTYGENYWEFIYDLKAGKRYNIFLVGEWVCNETDPITDYDIEVISPSGAIDKFTESAGLVEHVSNDEYYQYYVPDQSGEHTIKIINDLRDSTGTQPAIFMLIEHIDVNTEYSQYLEGRRYISDTATWNETKYSGWGYEFNTSSPRIKVFVDVPTSLDMYEARLYVMAIRDREVGYTINDIGIPFGEYFDTFQGEYGGYSALTEGDRNILAMDSAESKGQDLEFIYYTPASIGNGSNVYYYLAIIAEHNQGIVDFVVQTDFEPPVISLDPPEVGIEGEPTEITVTVEDETEIEEIWIEYSTDEGETWRTKDLSEKGDGYRCELGSLFAGEYVDFTIYAEDAFGNIGSIESGFQVKRIISLDSYIANKNLYGDESAMVTGSSNLDAALIELVFTSGEMVENYQIRTDENGAFGYTFAPPLLGEWSFQAQFEGSETEFPASCKRINFTVACRETHISGFLSETQVKKNEPITVAGSVMPKLPNLAVEILFVSSLANHMEEVSTSADGSFSYTYEPAEEGIWNVVAKVGDGFIYLVSSSDIMEFEVLPLTIIDKAYVMVQKMIEPPYLYGMLGFIGVGLSSVVYVKRDSVISALPSGLAKRLSNNNKKGKRKNGKNGKRYRRKKK